jgi:uncharacterized repeat protein (TIGR03837 family)
MTWDIFCTVIDNFGDIGVTWRLARQLAAEHGVPVRLWVDDLESFRRIRPEVDPGLAIQSLRVGVGAGGGGDCPPPGEERKEGNPKGVEMASGGEIPPNPPFAKGGAGCDAGQRHGHTVSSPSLAEGGAGCDAGQRHGRAVSSASLAEGGTGMSVATVEVRRWTSPLPDVEPGEVVIEALACDLPDEFVARMTAMDRPPVWLNLEYLTAEDWAGGVHGLPSPHPRLPLTKYFFMPGYGPGTGGLIRESWLLARRDAFRKDAGARAAFWDCLGLPGEAAGELRLSLFSYENDALPDLLSAWAEGPRRVRALVPAGKALPGIAGWFGLPDSPAAGAERVRGALTVHVLPMLDQDAYDRLLWACDVNFVRGEDSFSRAQFAARPLVWQAYRQEEEAHLAKLEAFLDLYCAGMDGGLASTIRAVWRGWNRETPLRALWPAYVDALPALERHARVWCECLAKQSDLASNLLIFCKKKLE